MHSLPHSFQAFERDCKHRSRQVPATVISVLRPSFRTLQYLIQRHGTVFLCRLSAAKAQIPNQRFADYFATTDYV
jgi:hypothetical protein